MFLPAVGANAALPPATIGGHKLELEKCSPQEQPPFCHQRGDRNKIFQLNTTRGAPFPSLGMFLPAKTPPKRNSEGEESSGPIQGDRKFRNLASFAFAMNGSSRKWIPGVPKIKGCFLTPQRETVRAGKVLDQSKVTENSGTLPASPLQ